MSVNLLNPDKSNRLELENRIATEFDIMEILSRFLVYWPLLIIVLMISFGSAWVYLRYTPKVYGAKSLIAIINDNELDGSGRGGISITMQDNMSENLEKVMNLMTSPQITADIVKRLHLYSEITVDGRIGKKILYGSTAPVSFKLQNPSSTTETISLNVQYKPATRQVSINGVNIPTGQWVNTPFGIGMFTISSKRVNVSNFNLTVHPISTAVVKFSGSIEAKPNDRGSSLIALYAYDYVPQRAVDMLDTLVKVYDEYIINYKKQKYLNTAQFITDRLSIVEKELSGVEQQMSDTKSNMGGADVQSQSTTNLARATRSDEQLADIKLQLEVVERAKRFLESRTNDDDPLPVLVNMGDASIVSQLSELFKVEAELRKARQVSGPEHPRVVALEMQMSKLKPAIIEGVNNYRNNLLASQEFYTQKLQGLSGELRGIPLKEKALLDITRQQGIKNSVFSFLLQKREENAIEVAATVSNSQFIHTARQLGLLKPVAYNTYGYFVTFSLFILFIFVVLRELLASKIESRGEVERSFAGPIVGELLQYDGLSATKDQRAIVVNSGARTIVAEQFRELRTSMRYLANDENKKVILVTSAVPGDGKTFVSINVAVSFSLSNKKVVILGFDMRKPKMAKELGIENTPGLSNYLVGQNEISEIIKPVKDFDNLRVIASGTIPPNPSELILNDRLETLMQYLRNHFDIIIVDSPPVGSVTDAKLLAYHADMTLFVVRHLHTPKRFLRIIRDIYMNKRLPNMGIVINGLRQRKFLGYSYGNEAYGNYYSYNSMYGYGYTEELEPKKSSKKAKQA